MLKAIVCHDSENGIGLENKVPWKIPSEMQHFIKETKNKTIVMGWKTFNSLGNKPLKNRRNIVLSKNNTHLKFKNIEIIDDIDFIIKLSEKEDVYIIGGSKIYKVFEDYIDQYIISSINQNYNCDTFFTFSKKFFNLKFTKHYDDFKLEKWTRNKKILNGRKVSSEIIEKIKVEFQKKKLEKKNFQFIIIQIGNDFASSVYIKQKIKVAEHIGIFVKHVTFKKNVSQEELILKIRKYNSDANISAILVQNPLPKHIDENVIAMTINPLKDIDCFNPLNLGILYSNKNKKNLLSPCTPLGIIEILKFYKIDMNSKNVVIINRSNIVGKPLSILFLNENSTITICHTKTKNIKSICKKADILISATGVSKWIKNDYIKKNAICIDVGINREQGKLCGDFDFENVFKKCSLITPVPFGIGPMTIAMLFLNFMKLIDGNIINKELFI